MYRTTTVEPVKFSLRARLPRATLWLAAAATLACGSAIGCDSTAVAPPGAGGSKGAGGAGGAGSVAAIGCADPDPGVLDYIDNMEDGDNRILSRDGRVGYWYTYDDGTVGGKLNPDMGTAVVMEPIPGGRCGATTSTRAMRLTGGGFNDWGSAFAFSLKYMGMELPYDGSRFKGLTFWARIGETSVDTIRVAFGDQWSRPDGGHCTTDPKNGPIACYDTFGSDVTLGRSWERHTVLFGQTQQRSFGLPRDTLDQTTLMTVEFAIAPGAPVFDIWVDDVAFF
jgi:hypothetical protein